MRPDEIDYLRGRAEQERLRAEAARDGTAAVVHRQLAAEYRERVARLVPPHMRVR